MTLANRDINSMLDQVVADHETDVALVFEEQSLSYATFQKRIQEVARGFLALGVRPGDRVGLLTSTRPEWLISAFAATRIGATMVGLNTWYEREELVYALNRTNVSTLVTMDSFLEQEYLAMLEEAAPELPNSGSDRLNVSELPTLQQVIAIGNSRSWTVSWDSLRERGMQVSAERVAALQDTVSGDDIAYLLFSSGTTGRPKPIALRHDGLVSNGTAIGSRIGVSSEDRFWLGLPLFFSFAACNETFSALTHGATLVFQEQFDAQRAIELIEAEDCSIVYGMGNMFKQIESTGSNLEATFESVRRGFIVAPEPLQRRFETEYGIDVVVSGYGLTETSAICTANSDESPIEARMGTVGYPVANADVRIKEFESNTEVPLGEEGEICVRSRPLFAEYDRDRERTEAALDADGYLRTGDVGRLDPDGRVKYIGRQKDVIKTGGINVSPQEVEMALERYEGVAEAVVVPIDDPEKEELVGAMVRPDADASIDPTELRKFIKERLASYKVPSVIEVHPESFPRTSTGKIRKTEIKDELSE